MGRSHLHTNGKLHGIKHHRRSVNPTQRVVALSDRQRWNSNVLPNSGRQQHRGGLCEVSESLLPNIRSIIDDNHWLRDWPASFDARSDRACVYKELGDHHCSSPVLASHADLLVHLRSPEASY